jgi:hypothetical protein
VVRWRGSRANDLVESGEDLLMPTHHDSTAAAPAAPAAVSVTSQKMLQLLRRRLRQLARITIVMAVCLALGVTALAIWWLTSLNGLPDIGDPFDVAAFRAVRIPDDQNAFSYLGRAAKMVTEYPSIPRSMSQSDGTVSWSKADPKLRAWVEENAHAIALFQQAGEQADAGLDLAADFSGISLSPNMLSVLVLLEASKRQEAGDTAGAWDCYRAVLRVAGHVVRRGNLDQQHRVNVILLPRGWLQQRLATWAADPRTTIPQLKIALDEVLGAEPKPEWDSVALKTGYLEIMRWIEQPIRPLDRQHIEGEWTVRLGDMQLPADLVESIEAARRSLLREPERSRRVLRLLFANWLAQAENPELQARKPAVRVVLTGTRPISLLLYDVSRVAPYGARALPPQEVARWLVATRDAKLQILGSNGRITGWPPNRAYRKAHREIVMMLAKEIDHRERGALPLSAGDRIGLYLKNLPDDNLAGPADETTPTVK